MSTEADISKGRLASMRRLKSLNHKLILKIRELEVELSNTRNRRDVLVKEKIWFSKELFLARARIADLEFKLGWQRVRNK